MEEDRISLKVEFRETDDPAERLAYALHGEVTEAEGIPPEIFVFHRSTRVIATGFPWDMEVIDYFQNVATPVDIEDTVDESLAGEGTRHFRSRSFDLLFRNEDDRERAKDGIDKDIAALVSSWRRVYNSGSYGRVEEKEYTNDR